MSYLLDSGFLYAQISGKVNRNASASRVTKLAETDLFLENPIPEDHSHSAQTLNKYNDANIDFVACIAVIFRSFAPLTAIRLKYWHKISGPLLKLKDKATMGRGIENL